MNRRALRRLLCSCSLPLGLALLPSCATSRPSRQEGLGGLDLQELQTSDRGYYSIDQIADKESPGYFEARVEDFLDMLSLRLWVGPGLGARAAVTKLLQVGVMARGPAEPFGEILRVKTLAAGNTGRSCGIWDVRSAEYGLLWWYHYEEDVFLFADDSGAWRGAYEDRAFTAIEASLHLALVGATLSFDPIECLDFVVGVLGFGEGGFLD
jgi:hypothetical protein